MLYFLVTLVSMLFVLPVSSQELESDTHETGSLEVIPELLEFGRVFDGDKPVKTVILRNAGSGPLTIKRLHTSCGCAIPMIQFPGGKEVNFSEQIVRRNEPVGILQPDEEAKMQVSFTTWGYTGKLKKRILIECDDAQAEDKEVLIRAEIVDSVSSEPESLDLGEVVRGRKASAKVVIRSIGIGDFDIKGIKNLPSYLRFQTEKQSDGSEVAVELKIETRGEPPLGDLSLPLKLGIENKYIDETRILLKGTVVPKIRFSSGGAPIRDELDMGVFYADQGKNITLEISNLFPGIPYQPVEMERKGMFENPDVKVEIEEVTPGNQYRLHIKVPGGMLDTDFFRGSLWIFSDHPDLLLKKLHVTGWSSLGATRVSSR